MSHLTNQTTTTIVSDRQNSFFIRVEAQHSDRHLFFTSFILAQSFLTYHSWHFTRSNLLAHSCSSFFHTSSLLTVNRRHSKSSTLFISTPYNLAVPPGFLSFTHYSFSLLLTFIPRLSRANLPTSLQITVSSANIMTPQQSVEIPVYPCLQCDV